MNDLQSPNDARDAFGIQAQEGNDWYEFVPFIDGKPGFSIKRSYPDTIPYKPPMTQNGTPDTVAMIRVLFNPENLSVEKLDPLKIPLWIAIDKHSKYRYTHFDYDHNHNDCPTVESLAISYGTPDPKELKFLNNYTFNKTCGEFLDTEEHKMSGKNVLQFVFDQHCKTTQEPLPSQGQGIIELIEKGCDTLIHGLNIILRFCFRKRFNDMAQSSVHSFRKEDIVLLKAVSLDFLGYKTTKNVILTYAALFLFAYGIVSFAGISIPKSLAAIWKNPFLALCMTLVTLPLLEHLGPQVIRLLVNGLKKICLLSRKHLYSKSE